MSPERTGQAYMQAHRVRQLRCFPSASLSGAPLIPRERVCQERRPGRIGARPEGRGV